MIKFGCLFGHRDIYDEEDVKKRINNAIIDSVENKKIYNFYLGNNGRFDQICARCIKELKKTYPQIKSCLVLAYLNNKLDEFEKNYIDEMFDYSIYPPLENVPKRVAIIKRNEWMVNNSNYVIFLVNYTWGGAYKILEYTKRKKKCFLNLGDVC